MVVPLRDIGNKFLFTSTTMNSYSNITLPSNMGMDIDNFISRNVDNYDDVRGHTITPNKTTSRTVFMSLSETSVNYATRIEQLSDISDKGDIRDPIDSSQLSYAEIKEVQVSRATDHNNRACLQ